MDADVVSDRSIARELGAAATLVVCMLLLVGWRTLFVFFAVDDLVYLAAQPSTWPGFTEAAANRWLSGPGGFALGREVFGLNPLLFHLPLILGHGLNALLLWALVRRLAPVRPLLAHVSAVVFAGHAAAYTALAWLSAGMNEVPTLTVALLSVHFVLQSMHGRPWLALAGAVLVAIGSGLKQHVVVTVVYVVVFGWYYARCRSRDSTRAWVPGLALGILLTSALFAWMALYVQPRMPRGLLQEPYTHVYSVTSMASGFVRYLPHALNPLAAGRESLGYQAGLPVGLEHWLGPDPVLFRSLVTVGWAVLIAFACRFLKLSLLGAAAACVLIGTLVLPASMPRHQYDYYVYFGLPVASLLAAIPIVALIEALRARLARRAVWALSAIGAVVGAGALLQGKALHDSNQLVASAAHTQLIDRIAAEAADGDTMYFVPPVDAAHEATLGGASVAILRSNKRLTVWFAERGGAPAVFDARPGWTLLQTRRLAGPHWQAMLLSQAYWGSTVTRQWLDEAHELVQPFPAARPHIAGLEFPAEWYGKGCTGDYALEGPLGGPSVPVVTQGQFDCRTHVKAGLARFPLQPVTVQATAVYQLRFRMTAGSLQLPLVAASSDVLRPAQHRYRAVVESLPGAIGLRVVERVSGN